MAKIAAESFQAELWTGHLEEISFPKGYFTNIEVRSLKAYQNSPWWVGFSKIFQLWWAFAHFPESTVRWAIFSGSLSPLAHKKISGKKILYCLTPPRLLYDQKNFMVQQIPLWQRPFLKMVMGLYLPAYERATQNMDIIITISETVRERIRRFLRHDSQVIYPPCDTERFRFLEQGNFYLSTARLDPLKRVDVIVRAFLKMPEKNLVVVSGGSERLKIKKAAEGARNIQVLGWVDEERLCDLMGRCIASMYIPRDEDFGISPVESMAAGKPVIGVQEGGVLETVGEFRGRRREHRGQRSEGTPVEHPGREPGSTPEECTLYSTGQAGQGGLRSRRLNPFQGSPDGEIQQGREGGEDRNLMITDCGVLVPSGPNVEDVIEAVEWMTPERALKMRGACEERAKRFDKEVFIEKMREVIEGG